MTATRRPGAALTFIAALGVLTLGACGRSSPDSRTGPDTAPTGQNTVSSTGSEGAAAADSGAPQGASSATAPPASGNQPNSQ